MKKIVLLGIVLGLLPAVSFGAYFGAGNNTTAPAPLNGAQPITQNVYLAGGTINVSNPVAGDLLTAGGTIFLSGKVDKDIMAIGGTISMAGGSAEDVRIVGGNITISGKVNGEVAVAGGQINVTPDAVIAKDSYIVGGTLIFSGTENGNLTLAGGQIQIDGTVNGNLTIPRAGKVSFGPRAIVKGTVEYSAPSEAVVESGAQLAVAPVFHKTQSASQNVHPWFLAGLISLAFFLKVIATLAVAYLLWYLRRRDMTTAIENIHGHFWRELLRGFAVLVLAPIAGIILLITVVGWIPAAIIFAAYVALLVLMAPVTAIVATSFLMTLFKKSRTNLLWYHILGGFVVLSIVAVIPIIGWLAYFVVYLVSLGATANILKEKFSA